MSPERPDHAHEAWFSSETDLRRSLTLCGQALDKIRQGLCVFDGEQRLLLFNRQYAEMYNLAPESLRIGMTLRDVIDLRYAAGTGPNMAREEYAAWRDRIAVADRVVETIVELRNGAVHEIHHEPTPGGGWVATFDDITERRRIEDRIRHMARHDALTDLPNRFLFRERLEQALAASDRRNQLALLYLDLDRFKSANDTLGHAIGDALLCSVAERVRGCLGAGDLAARLGGDEFGILQGGVRCTEEAADLARRIVVSLRKPYHIDGHALTIGASIGIALAPSDGADPDEVLKNADIALYHAKRDGRGTYRFFKSIIGPKRGAVSALSA